LMVHERDQRVRYAWQVGVEAAQMHHETVVLSPSTRKFCVLNETAAHLWTLLERPRTETELAMALCERFAGVDRSTAEADVRETLQQLVELGIVQAVTADDVSA
jgi:coenzyme PQQ synthesis protein D (PqqD)